MKKETLTITNCKRDLLHQLKLELIGRCIITMGMILFCGLLSLLLSVLGSSSDWSVTGWAYCAVWVIPAAYLLFNLRHLLVYRKRIHAEAFSVSEAKLNNMTELEIKRIGDWLRGVWHFRGLQYRYDHNVFYFSSYGRYVVPDMNFTWSGLFRMNDDGLKNYSSCGDDFYLLVYTEGSRKGKVAYAYPAKLFEWQKTDETA